MLRVLERVDIEFGEEGSEEKNMSVVGLYVDHLSSLSHRYGAYLSRSAPSLSHRTAFTFSICAPSFNYP